MRLFELYARDTVTLFGNRYDLSKLREIGGQLDDQSLSVADVEWNIEGKDLDETDVQDADAAAPVIVTEHGGKIHLIDGALQVAKAVQQGQSSIFAIYIDDRELDSCCVQRATSEE